MAEDAAAIMRRATRQLQPLAGPTKLGRSHGGKRCIARFRTLDLNLARVWLFSGLHSPFKSFSLQEA